MIHAHPDSDTRYEVLGDRLARLQALAELLGTSPTELLSRDSAPASDHLSDLVTRMRAEIAHAAGTTPSKVRITIEM